MLRAPPGAGALSLLAEALALVGHAAIRYRGTVGGSLAHADPSAELPAVAMALDAEVVAAQRAAARGPCPPRLLRRSSTTALEPDEMLVEVPLPDRSPAGTGSAFIELARRHGDFALVGVAARGDDRRGGIGRAPVRLRASTRCRCG